MSTWHSSGGLGRAGRAHELARRVAFGSSHLITVLSAEHATRLPDVGVKVAVVPNDVAQPDHVKAQSERGQDVVFAGEVGLRKGADLLVKAWTRCAKPGWTLHVFGRATPDFSHTMEQAARRSDVLFHGLVDGEQVEQALQHAAIAVLPSRAEALPMFLLEAMSNGCAVIGSSVGAVPALLADGAGLLVEPGDERSLSNALSEAMASPQLRASMSEKARARIASAYESNSLSREWATLYRSVIPF